MILRKPYAFFIKMFKPIHLAIGLLIGYLMVSEGKIFGFLDSNIYTSINYVGQEIKSEYVSSSIFVIPIILILLFIGIFAIMFNRKKPVTFYAASIISVLAILIVNIYVSNFFSILNKSIVSVKSVKLIHDLVFLSLIVEGILLIFVIIRGAGVNIQKFNFDSDISKIDIKESDSEEFEVNIKFNIDKTRRERNKRLRYLKYLYAEKKLVINIAICVFLLLVGVVGIILYKNRTIIYSEGTNVITNTCGITVDGSYIVDKSYDGNKITDNYLIVVDSRVKKNYKDAKVYLNDFTIRIGNATYTPTTMYNKYLIDLGIGFDADKVGLDYANYLFVYEVSEKVINKKITFTYNDGSKLSYIRIKPQKDSSNTEVINKTLGEELVFGGRLSGISLKIDEFDIKDKYALKYDFCITKDDCIKSTEYIKGTINKDYDKSVIRIKLDYKNESKLNLPKLYNLLSTFGYIEYKIGDSKKVQTDFEMVTSKKYTEKGINYLGVKKELMNATEINFIFNIRGTKYIYKVK